jgi:hypothetical protein
MTELLCTYTAFLDHRRVGPVGVAVGECPKNGINDRWAKLARAAVLNMTSNQGDTATEVLADVEARMEKLGIKWKEEIK